MAPEGAVIGVPDDRFGPEQALRAPVLLRTFNQAGVLAAADVHVARMLERLAGVDDEAVLLAVALAVRAPRMGHVFADLATAAQTVEIDTDTEQPQLPWPQADGWASAVRACEALVGVVGAGSGGDAGSGGGAGLGGGGAIEPRPLRLDGTRLYLDRYWREEQALAEALRALAQTPVRDADLGSLAAGAERLLPDPSDSLQRAAVGCGALRGLTVIAGGPGTGKTTTVAMLLALLFEQAAASAAPEPLVALCAPTGKAAARLQEAIHQGATTLAIPEPVREQMLRLRASTIHRLLGWLPGGRLRLGPANRLAHDLVIVDETSMVALSLMARLVGAVRSDARIVLVGDPDQLTAIEAGAVLRDIVGPAAQGSSFGPGMRSLLRVVTGADVPAAAGSHFGDGIVVLRRGHRFGSGIGAMAEAIRLGDGDGAITALGDAHDEITWIPEGTGEAALRRPAVESYGALIEAARAGEAQRALSLLDNFRILCAHRRGAFGVSRLSALVEQWLAEAIEGFEPSDQALSGRPLLITENDHELRLNNGDTGVIVEGMGAVFERDGGPVGFAPSRLGAYERLYAMTIHKSQGSQFDVAAVILPEPDSRILTRELLYTAVTRARRQLILVAGEASIRAAVARPVARATGLQELLWEQG